MKLKNYLTILICVLLSTLSFTACSSDDDEEGDSNSSLTINGEPYYGSECTFDGTDFTSWLLEEGSLVDGFMFDFSVDNLDEIKVGDEADIDISFFNRTSNVTPSYDWENCGGSVVLDSKTTSTITLRFKNLVIAKEGKENNGYVLNGSVKYTAE